jgi:hypothetical protein
MPIGCFSCVAPVVSKLLERRRGGVLDLGIGMGFYGAVVRQWLDCGVRPWKTHLVGVEGFEGYRNPAWDLYDRVDVEPIEQVLKLAGGWPAILMLDVIEHFDADQGEEVVSLAVQALAPGGTLIIATPAVHMEQGAAHGNELERHRSLWTPEAFKARGFELLNDGSPDQYGHYMIVAAKDS